MKTITIDDKTVILLAQTAEYDFYNVYREDKHLLKVKLKRNDLLDDKGIYEYAELSYIKPYRFTFDSVLNIIIKLTGGHIKDIFQHLKKLVNETSKGFFEYNGVDIIID